MYRIVFATGNAGKMKEIREILADLPAEIQSMKEAGVTADIVEDGSSFEENALIKARAVAELLNDGRTVVLADDSGLEIDYLNGEPGHLLSPLYGGGHFLPDQECKFNRASGRRSSGEADGAVCLRHRSGFSRREPLRFAGE